MKIGIFGGSFNPPHKVHRKIVEALKKKGYVDKVIIVPTGLHYEYKSNLVDNRYRLDMLHLLFQNLDYVSISDYEMKEYPVYTYQTLDYFKTQYPQDDIYFICGMDNLSYMNEWKQGSHILTDYKILIIDRDTNNVLEILTKLSPYKNNIILTDIKPDSISSTKIRQMIKNQEQNLELYLAPEVAEYIRKECLYES